MPPTPLRCVLLAALLAQIASVLPASAQSFAVVARDGDVLPGVGRVTRVDGLALGAGGAWLLELDTDHGDPQRDAVLLHPAGVVLREGDALAQPGGAAVAGFGELRLDAAGRWLGPLELAGAAGSAGLYHGPSLLAEQGAPVPAAGLPAGTTWGAFEVVASATPTLAHVLARLVDPLGGAFDALVRLDLQPDGALAGAALTIREGDFLSGAPGEGVLGVEAGARPLAARGDHLLWIGSLLGPVGEVHVAVLDGAIVAREGTPWLADPARSWEVLADRPCDVDAQGRWALRANLDGPLEDDEVIVVDGTRVVAREGDALGALGGAFRLSSFGSGPVDLADTGEVLWFGVWDDPDFTRNRGLFVEGELLVQQGVTRVGGLVVETLLGSPGTFAFSDDARWVLFECRLEGGVDAAVLVDRQAVVEPFCGGAAPCPCGNAGGADTGCRNSVGPGARLEGEGLPSLTHDALVLRATGLPRHAPAALLQGAEQTPQPFGDGLRCLGAPVTKLGVHVAVEGAVAWPAPGGPSLAELGQPSPGLTRVYQAWYRNVAGPCGSGHNLSNAVRVVWVE